MIDTNHRAYFQKLIFDQLVLFLNKKSITPNQLTTIALVSGSLIAISLWYKALWISLVLLLVSGLCDILDGSLARLLKRDSPKGAAFDIFSDRCVEISIISGFYLYSPKENGPYAFMMLASVLICITSFLVVGIFINNLSHKSFHYSPGLMERTEAFFCFALMMIFPSYFPFLALLFAILVSFTGIKRMFDFQKDSI